MPIVGISGRRSQAITPLPNLAYTMWMDSLNGKLESSDKLPVFLPLLSWDRELDGRQLDLGRLQRLALKKVGELVPRASDSCWNQPASHIRFHAMIHFSRISFR